MWMKAGSFEIGIKLNAADNILSGLRQPKLISTVWRHVIASSASSLSCLVHTLTPIELEPRSWLR